MDNSSIDKLAEQYASDEEDQKIFLKAQQATIISQTKQINESRRKIEDLSKQVQELTIENTRLKATGGTDAPTTEDAETIALVQLALLRSYSMQRELTLEESKRYEIFVKALKLLKGKNEDSQVESIGNISTEELMKALKEG